LNLTPLLQTGHHEIKINLALIRAMVSTGANHTVLLRSDGCAVAAGENRYGQCDIPPCDAGARQHVIRNAWRAWCLHTHCQSNRRDRDLDCFDNGVFRRIDWDGVRKFAASGPEARAVATGGCFSPAAFHSAQNFDVDDTCIWHHLARLSRHWHF